MRIVIADSYALLRNGLRCLLEAESDFEVVGEAANGGEAVHQTQELTPDILLLGWPVSGVSGLDVIRELSSEGVELRTRIIVLAEAMELTQTVEALQMGARGVVTKETSVSLLMKAIRTVMAGQYWLGREDIGNIIDFMRNNATIGKQRPDFGLTKREMEVLTTLVEGLSNKEIACKFSLSQDTVKHHLTNIFDKLGVASRLELALFAISNRLVVPATVHVDASGIRSSTHLPR